MKLKGNIEDLAYETSGSAAVDLRSAEDIVVPVSPLVAAMFNSFRFLMESDSFKEWQGKLMEYGQTLSAKPNTVIVPTGVYLDVAYPSEYIFITPRSGLANKHAITVLNSPGLIDSDYPGQIGVIMTNHGVEPFEIKKGDRIAQMLLGFTRKFENIPTKAKVREGGFGSTGAR